MSYEILNYCSTRVIPDVTCEDFIDYIPGTTVENFPAHVPVEEWIKTGHIKRIKDKVDKTTKEEGGEIDG